MENIFLLYIDKKLAKFHEGPHIDGQQYGVPYEVPLIFINV
jgi:hypothetical protein